MDFINNHILQTTGAILWALCFGLVNTTVRPPKGHPLYYPYRVAEIIVGIWSDKAKQ